MKRALALCLALFGCGSESQYYGPCSYGYAPEVSIESLIIKPDRALYATETELTQHYRETIGCTSFN